MSDPNTSPRPDQETRHVEHRVTEFRETSSPMTAVLLGGLVLAVGLMAFLVFGRSDPDQQVSVNLPPAAEESARPESSAPAQNAPAGNENGQAESGTSSGAAAPDTTGTVNTN